jgi:GntR family transcriptional repressor for pyruvate dehydrogenase complex
VVVAKNLVDKQLIKTIKTEKVHTQVYEQLRAILLEGHWRAGEKIPSETELCRLMGVSRISVRTALNSLIAQGFLVPRQGEGTFVVDVSVDMNMNMLVPIIGLDKGSILEVLEFRKILEVGIVPLVFQNLTGDDVDWLLSNVEELEGTAEEEIARITELDLGFHRKLCEISGNSLVIKVNKILNELFRTSMENVVIALGNQTGRKYHRRIVDVIAAGDREGTVEILREHIQNTIDNIIKIQQDTDLPERLR